MGAGISSLGSPYSAEYSSYLRACATARDRGWVVEYGLDLYARETWSLPDGSKVAVRDAPALWEALEKDRSAWWAREAQKWGAL